MRCSTRSASLPGMAPKPNCFDRSSLCTRLRGRSRASLPQAELALRCKAQANLETEPCNIDQNTALENVPLSDTTIFAMLALRAYQAARPPDVTRSQAPCWIETHRVIFTRRPRFAFPLPWAPHREFPLLSRCRCKRAILLW